MRAIRHIGLPLTWPAPGSIRSRQPSGKVRRSGVSTQRPVVRLVAWMLLTSLALGCWTGGNSTAAPGAPPTREQPATARKASPDEDWETWEAVYFGETKAGSIHTSCQKVTHDQKPLLQFTAETKLKIARFGQTLDYSAFLQSHESTDGRLVSFSLRNQMGPVPTRINGQVREQKLHIQIETQGSRTTQTLDWKPMCGGFFAVEQSLRKEPMKVGEHRQIRALAPGMTSVQLATARLDAERMEDIPLQGEKRRLMRIKERVAIGGQEIESVNWVDDQGEVLKATIFALKQTTVRTSRDDAQSSNSNELFDLGKTTIVPIATALDQPYETKQVVYDVIMSDGDPAQIFARGASQRIESLGPHHARITVRRLRPDQSIDGELRDGAPTEADTASNSVIQTEDELIKAAAARIAPQQTDPWLLALELEKWVNQAITKKNYEQGFATAADVIRTRAGDCTEHAVLLTALARARNLPARVVVGLVYSQAERGLAFHMWNEIWIRDRWIPLDGTLGLGGVGAARLKLADSNMEAGAAEAAMMQVLQVVNRLSVQIIRSSS